MSNSTKVAIITGASQGMGADLVKAYREAGYKIIATSRSIKPSIDENILTVNGDISEPGTADRIIEEAIKNFGRVDTLINNAGIFMAKPFTQFTENDWKKNIATNLAGFFHITQRAIEVMESQKSGHIVQITTTLADQPINGVPSVLASLTKGGLNAATRSLAIEYASKGIRVNAVSPGVIKTPMHPQETHAALASLHPLGRMGEIQDIVDAVIFLEKSQFITGEILHVDGGQSAGHW
ncbi:TPA: SDR family oxidoreductase [Klebsiella pneumoniae]|uniref:SDR family NAD(P)-dependent oxidoreductase n=1 Tax=Klebsiella pneumoniae TaxID=573 RepID=UPI000C7DB3D0|nr:SDR family oxidoreductase [Klebsiella pneumoniae]HDG7831614.1 SDR family oxidoreductase [Klebsiella quasipneumoniae]HDS3204295.1 SDR family oxidoreductase [Klebsiella pneumoniae subsp. pneumoniae]EIV9611015.1 SDR family oxidoreductase [Klebsiella pneumoniae]EIW8625766.1 SDR family oxidoreductase [Klebsiella pneumoniae]EKZ9736826.1 SDR family oxidoreductase [Klebsiella pneumoniae]